MSADGVLKSCETFICFCWGRRVGVLQPFWRVDCWGRFVVLHYHGAMRDVLVLALVVVIILHAAYGAMVFGAGVIDFVANRLLYRAIRVLDGLAPDAVHSLVYGPAVASTTGAISGIAINKISDGGDIRAIVAAAVWVLASISFTVGFGALFAKRSGERRGVALMREKKVRRAEISSMFKGGNVALADMERDLAAVRRLLRVGTRLAERSEALSPLRWIWHQQSVKRRLLLVLSIVLSGVELSIFDIRSASRWVH